MEVFESHRQHGIAILVVLWVALLTSLLTAVVLASTRELAVDARSINEQLHRDVAIRNAIAARGTYKFDGGNSTQISIGQFTLVLVPMFERADRNFSPTALRIRMKDAQRQCLLNNSTFAEPVCLAIEGIDLPSLDLVLRKSISFGMVAHEAGISQADLACAVRSAQTSQKPERPRTRTYNKRRMLGLAIEPEIGATVFVSIRGQKVVSLYSQNTPDNCRRPPP